MEDVNYVHTPNDNYTQIVPMQNAYKERVTNFAANGHNFDGESSNISDNINNDHNQESYTDDRFKKRINPLKIHLGKRPFVDNSLSTYNHKKISASTQRSSLDLNPDSLPRLPKLIPKRKNEGHIFNKPPIQVPGKVLANEDDTPVPRLVPKSQLLQFKKSTAEKGKQIMDQKQNLNTQPQVKFKCRRCGSMSFKNLALLKEHQRTCKGLSKEPTTNITDTPSPESGPGSSARVTKKVFLCSACGTYYENWNLFLHMREVHKRHICLFCLGMFSKAEKLSAHLINKHNVQEHTYSTSEEFNQTYNGTLYLMCCDCDEIYSEKDNLFNHDCNKVIPRPVPVLVSKSSAKINNVKRNSELSLNGPLGVNKDTKTLCDNSKVDRSEVESRYKEQLSNSADISQESGHSIDINSKLMESYSTYRPDIFDKRHNSGVLHTDPHSRLHMHNVTKSQLSNGSNVKLGDKDTDPVPMDVDPPSEDPPVILETPKRVKAPDREGGIKLKLSLNNAKSPVIINSTVDPSIGLQSHHKTPTRTRKPPKRYEKDNKLDTVNLDSKMVEPPRQPSIKMTICDNPNSPFVKTTIFENNKETILETLLNNNLESPKTKCKSDGNTIMSTIYDNKIEENTLNRVPKLTVRVPKELLDKDSSSDFSDSDESDKLTLDDSKLSQDESDPKETLFEPNESITEESAIKSEPEALLPEDTNMNVDPTNEENYSEEITKIECEQESTEFENVDIEKLVEAPPPDEGPVIELTLNQPLDRYNLKELLRLFLATTVYNCIYCNHARKIAVNCKNLSLHMASEHKFKAIVQSITEEELMPETITTKIKTEAQELNSVYINLDYYDSEEKTDKIVYDYLFECFQCYFKTALHKDLYLHNRKMHQKTILLCVMCKSNFYSYSELLCHLCPGAYENDLELRYRCHLCNLDSIPSSFRLMVHLRKVHNSCDVCLEYCDNQTKLSSHVWKHKLHHLCFRCGIAYRNKPDITNHLFWKHGTESVVCKRCFQKKYPHIYHFCIPPSVFTCEECSLQFSKAVYLRVHKRIHSGETKHSCIEEGCTEKFVSKKLLMKHLEEHQRKLASEDLDDKEKKPVQEDVTDGNTKAPVGVIDLVNDDQNTSQDPTLSNEIVNVKKSKKKKFKDLMLDVNLPELNLSESDSSDESEPETVQEKKVKSDESLKSENVDNSIEIKENENGSIEKSEKNFEDQKVTEKSMSGDDTLEKSEEEKANEQQVLNIWDNFKKFQGITEKPPKVKTPPLVLIRKHVCDSDHDYCVIPNDFDEKSGKKKEKGLGDDSSSSSSSDSDSSCSCGSNCSCSSSSGSTSSSSSDSCNDLNPIKKKKRTKTLSHRRGSNGSNVDVMGSAETPVLVPEKKEPPIPETDLDTEESLTDEDFYDENPQQLANKMFAEKRNQLMMLATVAPSEGGFVSRETSRPVTPVKEDSPLKKEKEKSSSSKKKSKKKKRSKSSRKHDPIKLNISKHKIISPEINVAPAPTIPYNKLTISTIPSNKVQRTEVIPPPNPSSNIFHPTSVSTPQNDSKRASKRRRVPNKFYGYSSEDESSQPVNNPYQPPKLEWRKEDLPAPVSHKSKKDISTPPISFKQHKYVEPLRLKAPIPDPMPPKILMNTEAMDSDSDSSEEGALEIYQPQYSKPYIPPPSYLNSGTSSLPYAFQRPAGRQAREGESVYCYCRCPYDEVSEMIACDADGCSIEWFHFECVGIMVPPKGKWYCPECRKRLGLPGYGETSMKY